MIKKKKRKNPKLEEIALTKREISYLTDDLSNAIVYASPFFLTGAITLLNIGEKCKDCGEEYHLCECEKCDDCRFDRCLCNINYKNKDVIRKTGWKFIRTCFNDFTFDILQKVFYNKHPFIKEELKNQKSKWLNNVQKLLNNHSYKNLNELYIEIDKL